MAVVSTVKRPNGAHKPRTMSPAARKRISDGMKRAAAAKKAAAAKSIVVTSESHLAKLRANAELARAAKAAKAASKSATVEVTATEYVQRAELQPAGITEASPAKLELALALVKLVDRIL